MHNPYAASNSAELKQTLAHAPRPIAVWSLGLIFMVIAVALTVGACRLLLVIATHLSQAETLGPAGIELAVRVASLALTATVIAGLFRRKRWGRWVGLLAIAVIILLMLILPDSTSYANDAERLGGFVGRMVITPLLLAWWGYCFAFSDKAKRYFAPEARHD